jgi:hypothetical protein
MPYYGKGDKITFTGEVSAELFGVVGIVLRRRIGHEGHYVYDIKIASHIPPVIGGISLPGGALIPGINIKAGAVLKNVPASWFELWR